MGAVAKFVEKKIVEPVKDVVEGAVDAVKNGVEAGMCLMKGDLEGCKKNLMESTQGALKMLSGALALTDAIPGLSATPMGMAKTMLANTAEAVIGGVLESVMTGKPMGKAIKDSVVDSLPKSPGDVMSMVTGLGGEGKGKGKLGEMADKFGEGLGKAESAVSKVDTAVQAGDQMGKLATSPQARENVISGLKNSGMPEIAKLMTDGKFAEAAKALVEKFGPMGAMDAMSNLLQGAPAGQAANLGDNAGTVANAKAEANKMALSGGAKPSAAADMAKADAQAKANAAA
jgi:hypothetical protein